MTQTIIIVDKAGSLRPLSVKNYQVEELYKKCGFKNANGFALRAEWSVVFAGQTYLVQMYGKTDGKATMENKYDFPPPADTPLFFGSCALVGMKQDNTTSNHFVSINLSVELWTQLYEQLFGGFEDLGDNEEEDEEEEDELEHVPKCMKTKTGYLKDGFVVDDSDNSKSNDDDEDKKEEEEDTDDDHVGSELSEESYI